MGQGESSRYLAREVLWRGSFLHDEQRLLTTAIAKRWLLSCVARALRPGCKVDTMLILEGKQGTGKSSVLKALAGEPYFSDSRLDLASKDAFQNIQGVWVYELPELDALLKAEASEAKAFLTSTSDKYRPPYGKATVTVPRSTVFCGSVNHSGYLKDSSGNRRYWPVVCGKLDVVGLQRVRDQLWAEAVALYEAGEQWHLTDVESLLAEEEQELRLQADPWESAIAEWLAAVKDTAPATITVNGAAPFKVREVLDEGLGLTPDKQTQLAQRRVVTILEKLGYKKRKQPKQADGSRPEMYIEV